MVHKDLKKYDLNNFLIKYTPILTVGDYLDREYAVFSDIKMDNNTVIINLDKNHKLYDLLEKYERFTLSFLAKEKIDELTLIYDNDSFVSYMKEARFVYKLKKEKEMKDGNSTTIFAHITSFLGQEDED